MSATGRNLPESPRQKSDFYATPVWCSELIYPHLEHLPGPWLDPCVGSGAIVSALPQKEWYGYELRKEEYGNLDSLYQEQKIKGFTVGVDFLKRNQVLTFPEVKTIVTNPPYSLAEEFIRRSLELVETGVFLLRLNFLEGKKRSAFLKTHTPDVFVLSKRPSFAGKGTDATAYAWMQFFRQERTQGKVVIL